MKHIVILVLALMLGTTAIAQDSKQIYNPEANALQDIKRAVDKADKEDKHVMVMMGGNWCPWCIKFHEFAHNDAKIDSVLNADYELVLVNYDRRNVDWEMLEQLDFPQRFGFPVFIILDDDGEVKHIQNSAYLEKDKSYDSKKVYEFLLNWNAKAVDDDTYIKK